MTEQSKANERGPIHPDDEEAKAWTFTSDRWTKGIQPLDLGSYLWKKGDTVFLSFVQATKEGQGYLRDLIAGVEKAGLKVAVPNPLTKMKQILTHYGFEPKIEMVEDLDEEEVDVWYRPEA